MLPVKRRRLTPEQQLGLILSYHEHGMSAIALAERYKVTRQAIYAILRRHGVASHTHTPELRACGHCGAEIRVSRWKADTRRVSYCNQACYTAKLRDTNYQESTYGRRLAREAVRDFFWLGPWNVVHHIDNNEHNNATDNLMVFANHADHMRWHRGGGEKSGAVPLWRGDQWATKKEIKSKRRVTERESR